MSQPKLAEGEATGLPTNLPAWADMLRKAENAPTHATTDDAPREILAALSKHDAVVDALAAGLDRPQAQWTPAWKTRVLPTDLSATPFPHFQTLIYKLTRLLCLRSIAAARAGDSVKASEALGIALAINEATLDEPFLFGPLYANDGTRWIDGAIWELCDARIGSAEELRTIELATARLDYRQAALAYSRSELVFEIIYGTELAKDPNLIFGAVYKGDSPRSPSALTPVFASILRGWFDLHKATLIRDILAFEVKPLRDDGFDALFKKEAEYERLREEHAEHPLFHFQEFGASAGMFFHAVRQMAYTQCLNSEATIACALERYRIEHQSYPETLDALVAPGQRPLPLDVISGKPIKYRKTGNGRYALWCVGFDEKDDGGKRTMDKRRPDLREFTNADYRGDWVWDYPER